MPVTATGVRAVAAGKLATMVSQSSTFIARTGAVNATGALEFIHYPWLHANRASKRPCVIITPLGRTTDLNSDMTYVNGGTLQLRLLDTARYDDKADALDDFINFSDGVLSDVLETSRTSTAGLLTIQSTSDSQPPGEVDPKDNSEWENHYASVTEIEWAPFQG